MQFFRGVLILAKHTDRQAGRQPNLTVSLSLFRANTHLRAEQRVEPLECALVPAQAARAVRSERKLGQRAHYVILLDLVGAQRGAHQALEPVELEKFACDFAISLPVVVV